MSTDLDQARVVEVRPLLCRERADLLSFLQTISPTDWDEPIAVPGWTVKDLAFHVLDDDLGWLSRGRDGDSHGRLETAGENLDARGVEPLGSFRGHLPAGGPADLRSGSAAPRPRRGTHWHIG